MPGLTAGPALDAVARLLSGDEAGWVASKLARKYPLQQHFLIPLLRRMRRWQLAYYELLTYEAAASQDVDPGQRSFRPMRSRGGRALPSWTGERAGS
jgi:hypothetical protein